MDQPDSPQRELFIVDDDPTVQEALAVIFSVEGYRVTSFADGPSALEAMRAATPACILLDIHMPGMSGLDVLRTVNAHNFAGPVFIISGHADIPMAVEAIKQGAFDVIEKPFDADTVVDRVRDALNAWDARAKDETHFTFQPFPGRELLTPREREVLAQITGGASNKEAGRALGISPRTIEVHRARIMEKLGAKNTADLVRIVLSERRLRTA